MANSEDPDQTAPWSGSTLFAQTCLSKNKVITIVFCLFLFSVKLHIAHLYEVQVCIARKFWR